MKTSQILLAALACILLIAVSRPMRSATAQSANEIMVEDVFGRTLNQRGIPLIDWDGQLANPKISFFVRPPANAQFPATALLAANHQRLYFDLPSEAGADGPRKTISFPNASARVQVGISISPDRDSADEDHTLMIELTDASGARQTTALNLHVTDEDRNQPAPFAISLDFSKDRTGFFDDPQKREIVRQAANDWAYFIDEMNLATVPAGAETTFIRNPDGSKAGSFTTNE